jgi:glycerol-3-phosphate acyltransferase PlsX
MSEKKSIKIAIDAMGGDFAPLNEIQGALSAYNLKKNDLDLEIVLIGDENKIKSSISKIGNFDIKYSIVHAEEVVTMDDDASIALKKKKNSSLYKGIEMHSKGEVDAFVSAGNTGAVMSTGTVLLGRIKGVSRPTIGSFFPTVKDLPTLVVDVGANVDCKARFLYEFAIMGSIYSSQIYGISNPKVGLLNIGEEKSKGNEVSHEAYELIKNSNLNFIGNIEGRDILQGTADVVVCDGFTGNIVLKFAESLFTFLKSKFKSFAEKSIFNKLAMGLFKPILKTIFKEFDYQQYGGVPLLGVNGVVIIGHGKSTPVAIQNMIIKAIEVVEREVNKKIEIALNS